MPLVVPGSSGFHSTHLNADVRLEAKFVLSAINRRKKCFVIGTNRTTRVPVSPVNQNTPSGRVLGLRQPSFFRLEHCMELFIQYLTKLKDYKLIISKQHYCNQWHDQDKMSQLCINNCVWKKNRSNSEIVSFLLDLLDFSLFAASGAKATDQTLPSSSVFCNSFHLSPVHPGVLYFFFQV